MHPLQGDLQGVVVDWLSDEVGGIQLETLNGHIHVPMPCDHDHLGVRTLLLDGLKESHAIHDRHFYVAEDDRRSFFPENVQRLPAVFRGEHLITDICQRDVENIPNL